MSSILIVDDEEDIRSFLRLVLEAEGFPVRTATGAIEALQEIQHEKPEILLLDLMMPHINGEELCRMIRKDESFFDIHIIMVSARADTLSKVSCLESGADDYLVKPIDAKELIARVKSTMRMLRRGRGVGDFLDSKTLQMETTASSPYDTPLAMPRIKPRYGSFRVESLVGSGGMGNVFKGYDEQLERTVAIKVLSRSLSSSPKFVQKFRREAKIVASADHPGIAGIYTFGEQDGDFYFTMQWCSGGSIQDLIQRKGHVELLTAVDIVIQCIDALDAALAKGIVHRDIKPSNVMFDQHQRIKIVDFGLATADETKSHVTPSGMHGTPDYMAPEQAQSEGRVDHRADIYSLGIMFYLLLYGKLPFASRSAMEMVIKHATEPFPEYDPQGGGVPREAFEIMKKMTEKDPENRYQDYASCRRDLVSLREEIFSSTGVLLPRVENVAPSPIWKTEDYFEILSALYVSPHSGVLTVRSTSRLTFQFLVEKRHILFLEAPDAEQTIWKLLLDARLIQKEEVPPPGSDFRDHLMRFLINQSFGFDDVKKVYRQYLQSALMDAGRWEEIECEFHSGEVRNDDIEGLFIGDAILDLARTVIPYEKIEEYFEKNRNLSRNKDTDHILTSLSLTPEESFIASRIELDRSVDIEELCLTTGFPEEKVCRLVYVLLRLGICQWKSAPERKQPIKMASQKQEAEADYWRIAEQFFELARREFDQGNFWKVTELCKQSIRNHADQGKYYHLMAMAYAHHPRFLEDAEQCFNKAIELEPQEAEYHLSLAQFLLKQGQPQRAASEISRALELDPENPVAEILQKQITG